MSNEQKDWRMVTSTKTVQLHRKGLAGVWDAVVAWVTRSPRRTSPQKLTYCVYVKSDQDVRVDIMGADCE